MKNGITLLGLNASFEIIAVVTYINLQWTRKWFESGTFSIEIPLEDYNKDIVYIYTKDRPEMGRINQVNYFIKNGVKSVNISGYFLEKDLDKQLVYPKGTNTNIVDEPSWTVQKGKAETVAYNYFEGFKSVKFTQGEQTITKGLNITAGINLARGNQSEHHRYLDNLGNKIYKILKPSNLSYRVDYNLSTNTKTFTVISGKDLTQNNTSQNNPVVFSTKYGNINNINYLMSDVKYADSFIVTSEQDNNGVKSIYVYANSNSNATEGSVFNKTESSSSITNFATETAFVESLIADGNNALNDCKKTVSIQFNAMQGSYNYLTDFNIGDICEVEIPELNISVKAILAACYEVIKKGTWNMTTDFILID